MVGAEVAEEVGLVVGLFVGVEVGAVVGALVDVAGAYILPVSIVDAVREVNTLVNVTTLPVEEVKRMEIGTFS
jgi:hypothetical protein